MKFGYTIIYVDDPARSLAFYEQAFGMSRRFLHESGQYGELDTGETSLAFVSIKLATANFPEGVQEIDAQAKPLPMEIALVTPDVHAAYNKAVKAGAVGFVEPATKPWGQVVAYVRDLDGTLVELCSPMGGA